VFPGRKLTLLLIPEEGGRIYEFKIPRIFVGLSALLAAGAGVLLVIGARYLFEAHTLSSRLERLERERRHLTEAVMQIDELEKTLGRLQSQSDQLHRILGSQSGYHLPQEGSTADRYRYVSSVFRLQHGQVRTVPALWPVRGVLRQPFGSQGVLIATPAGSLVRATAAGRVTEAGYDRRLGHALRIDHGRGLCSLYGHNRILLAEAGEYVFRGQPIALSGAPPSGGEPALLYSVLEDGRPRDPTRFRLWL
jgi:septal ring factor EnvC (AmiA/AmiB activator)